MEHLKKRFVLWADDLIAKLFHPMPLIETVNQTEADEEARAIEENEDVEWM